ncbi:hypothetical protein [Methylobacillus sp.]|jgi:hypothetical protein|uniref:hypothetical protein n=1 Tax=Methylobacillus sp. TaxID=56818 RepID=UPI002FE1D8C6
MHQTTSNTTEVFEKFVRALPLEKVTLTEPEGLHLYGVRHRVPDRKALQAAIFKSGWMGDLNHAESIIEERIRHLNEQHGLTR